MDIRAALSTLETILKVTGPLIGMLVGQDKKEVAEKVLDGVQASIGAARMALAGAEHAAVQLREIADEMEAMAAAGGVGEAAFDAAAARIVEKTARLKAIVAAR